jgi:Na+-transporting NADH:ubiquinone oxidoreductase subunit NqrE
MTIPSGTITAASINTDFDQLVTDLVTATDTSSVGHDVSLELDVLGGLDVTDTSTRTLEFVPQDDMQLVTLALSLWNPDATPRSCTLALSSIVVEVDGSFTTSAVYTLGQTWSVAATTSGVAEVVATRTDFTDTGRSGPVLYLARGVRYQLRMTFTSASAITRSVGTMVLRPRWRR